MRNEVRMVTCRTRFATWLGAALACLVASMPSLAVELCQSESFTLDRIKETDKIRLGFRPASVPFSFLPDRLQGSENAAAISSRPTTVTIDRGTGYNTTTRADLPRGYSIDLCLEIVDEIMAELGLPRLELVFVPTDPGSRFAALSDESLDIECGTSSITVTRGGKVEFSHIIFVTGTKLLVRSGLVDEVLKVHAKGNGQARELEIEDLDGRRVAAAEGTTNYDALRSIRENGKLDFELVSVSDHDQGVDFLLADKVEAYATDDILLYGLKQKLTTMGRIPPGVGSLAVSGRFLSYDLYALMVRHNDSCFRWIVNKRLSRLFRSGEIGAIYKRWFGHLDAAPSRLFKNAITLQAIPVGK